MNAPSEKSLHFNDYWLVVRNRWPIILTILILTVGTAVVVTRSMPKIYQSSAVIQIEKQNPDLQVFRPEMEGMDPLFLQTEFEVIQSKKILYPVIAQLKLVDRWTARFGAEPGSLTQDQVYNTLARSMLQVRPFRNTKLIEIVVNSQDPQEAAEIANAIAKEYEKSRLTEIEERTTSGLSVADAEFAEQQERVRVAKVKIEELRRELGVDEVLGGSNQQAATLQEIDLQRKENVLNELRADYLARKTRYDRVANLSINELEKVLPTIGVNDGTVEATKTQLLQAESSLAALREQGFGAAHPRIQSSEALVADLRQKLNQSIEGLRQGLAIDLNVSQSKLEAQEKEVEESRERLRAMRSDKLAPFLDARREYEAQQQLLDILQARLTQEKVDRKIGVNPVKFVSQAEPNLSPVRPNFRTNIALSVAVGLFLGVSLAFFIEYLDTSIKSLDDVERFLNTPVVGVVPQGVGYLNQEGPDSPNAEAYRILRAKIDLGPTQDGAQTLTAVSGGPGEGKTTTLFNLAFVCANSGMKTLIVDADFRRHSIDRILGLSNDLGLADYLLGRGSVSDYIRESGVENLHVITSGRLPPESMGAMSPAKMAEAIRLLRPYYEVIIFDVPPILGMSDAAVLVRLVDSTLMVVQHRRYPRSVSLRVKRVVEEVNGRLVGVVLNNVHVQSDDSYYYHTAYYHYYGDGRRKKKAGQAKPEKKKKASKTENGSTSGSDRY
ncbi:MAG: exopolysaccharide regulatory tyrosine autokinase VpsO [Candidatus Methylacidiphilales bacterium]